MKNKKDDYDFDLIIPEEIFKKNKEEYVSRIQKRKLRLKRKVKNILFILLSILLIIISLILLIKNNKDFNKISEKCDLEKGYTCSYYEVRQYMMNK